VYSKQPTTEIKFRYHNDGDPETTWSTAEVVNSGLGHLGLGGVADNHMSLRSAPDGRLFLAAKDSDGAGFISLYVRSAAGAWSAPSLVDVDPHAAVTRPILVLDLENSEVYVSYADATSSLLYLNKANMTNPVFGPACAHVNVLGVSDVTSTKQNVKASMGLRVVGSTGGAASALHFNPITLVAGSGNLPVLTSVAPSSLGVDTGAQTITLTGSNFAAGAVVYFNGSDRPTTWVSATQLTARLMATDLQTQGTYPITVMNPKGGTSATVNATVSAAISSLNPSSATAATNGFTMSVNGTGFVTGAVVRFNGVDRTTTFVNATQLTAQILASDILNAGVVPVVVVNPGGSLSPPSNFTINTPAPVLTGISPNPVIVGGAQFTLTATGSAFANTSVVNFNGQPRTTTFVNATTLTAVIPATDLVATGTFPITVFTPAPGGGTSAAVALNINNPVPAITGLAPATTIVGTAGMTLTVNGTGFVSGSVVRFNGLDRTTTFVSPTQVTAQITTGDLVATGTFPITVSNPAPGGGLSGSSNLAVNNPAPILNTLSPTSTTAGSAAFVLTVNGTGFVGGSVVRFNGTDRTTTFVSSTQLTAQITAADVQTAGTFPITVITPAPGGGTSAAVNFTVNNLVPTLGSISPTNKVAGDPAFTLTVNGTNFLNTSVVRIAGNNRTTTFVSATQLTAQITAADVQTGGTPAITVFNPTPGGGPSNAINLQVASQNPVPTLTSINPTSKTAGDAAFTLTVNGTGYVATSVIKWNGVARTTNFVSATQLTAQITEADIASAGAVNVMVSNPTPGGGDSATLPFTVNTNPRTIQALNSSGGGASIIAVPIQITSLGDENAIGFTVTFDPALLSSPTAAIGSGAAGATLNTNSSQVAAGRYGVVLSLPTGQSFQAGSRQVVVVSFTSAVVSVQTDTPIGFGDSPVVREVSNQIAEPLLTGYAPGTVTITMGYEADVSPRPNGNNNGSITIADWVQVGRFSSGLDTVNPGSEFQRADCAPRDAKGNGSITISDWVQAGRYASGLDVAATAGGATGPQTGSPVTSSSDKSSEGSATDDTAIVTNVRLLDRPTSIGLQKSFNIEIETLGNENALGFSLMFDPSKYTFVRAEKSDEVSLGTLNVNKQELEKGRVGLAIALPAGQVFGVGTHQVVILTFQAKTDLNEGMRLDFADLPIGREVVDVDAKPVKTLFQVPGTGVNPLEELQFFVSQQYLDFLNRAPDAGGLEYWTNQIRECGTDAHCISQRRAAVSAAFFMSPEFQQTGYTIYRLYKAAYGQRPAYQQFMADRGHLVEGPQLAATTLEFARQFVQRQEFLQAYPDSLTPRDFVNRLYASTGMTGLQAERRRAIASLFNNEKDRAQVLLELIENPTFKEREYTQAFVMMQYFGYLRRDPDQGGFDFWLNTLSTSQVGNYQGMVCAFITSEEYQTRFGQMIPRTNQECGP
jgi:hypothetical protein